MLKPIALATAFTAFALPAFAAPQAYTMDPGHSQVLFSYNHLGMTDTYGMYSGFTGEIMFDAEDPAASSVAVTFPAADMITGFDARTGHFLQSGDFFNLGEFPDVTFTSTSIEVTGDNTANITGDLTLNGVTKSIVLDTVMNQVMDSYPFGPSEGKPAIGLTATSTLLRSDYNMGMLTPFIPDEIPVTIVIEAIGAD